jgi:two-component system, NarL family, sensor histidine kinase BarA
LSYQTVKRVLGESNLARKCLWLFAGCMLLLVTGSFWLYGSQTDKIVYDLNRFVGKALVNSAMLDGHKSVFVNDENGVVVVRPEEQRINDDLADLIRSRNFNWAILYADNPDGLNKPTERFEYDWMADWEKLGKTLTTDGAIDEAADDPEQELGREKPGSDPERYVYYQPVFAKNDCIVCHRVKSSRIKPYRPDWKVGDLMAVVRVEMDTKDARDLQAANRAWLWVLGIVTVFLSVLAMWFIIRYVIIKPLAHLRDVSDAVRRGDVEQRAVIHTGDEFEDLGAAFNRMLRQLLRQQDELRAVNGELDSKIDELAQLNMRLFETNKVKSDFLATVSHELRTPLNSILGFSDLLSTVKTLDDKQRRFASNIERSGRQLLDMINDMLDLAKIESGRMEVRPAEFDIGAVVMTQCDLVRPLAEKKHIELDCEIAQDLPPILQDRGKIEQILNNLLSNAVKFTPDGGRIHVTCRQDRRGDLRLIVADTGVGISESEQQVVFEKFRQGASVLAGGDAMKREYSGSGLGLSIVRELARLLGGDVTLESELGRGSEFTVIMPWSVAELGAADSPAAEELRQLAGAARTIDAAADI